jgi:nucleoside phosphorylase
LIDRHFCTLKSCVALFTEELTASKSKSHPLIDIGIITILDDEFKAVLDVFPDGDQVHRGHRTYTLRTCDAGDGQTYNLAILRLIGQGTGEAQNAARDLIDDFAPSLLIVVGIAGARPSDEFTLGDVVVSTRICDYCVESRSTKADEFSLSGGPIGKDLAAGVANLISRKKELHGWSKGLRSKPKVKWKTDGLLVGPKPWRNDVAKSLENHFGRNSGRRGPLFVTGAIASSDRLVKDPGIVIAWLKTARHLRAIEMESAGVYRAANERCPMLAIRGISDIVGLKRDDDWKIYACRTAAAFTCAYLRTKPVPPKSASPARTADTTENSRTPPDAPTRTEVFTNLLRLSHFPRTIHIAPATCSTVKQAWAKLLKGAKGQVPAAWVLHNKCIYSFEDPSRGLLRRISDVSAVEEHDTLDFAASVDAARVRLFVQLLNRALKQDLGAIGVHFKPDDQVYIFAGRPTEQDRKVKYRNVVQETTRTVVFHYPWKSKDGRTHELLRHLGFEGRFRKLGGKWYLELNPTYRFTSDGRDKSALHERRLSKIKRIEKNRSVLSQVLLWLDLLGKPFAGDADTRRLLRFEKLEPFRLGTVVPDGESSDVSRRNTQAASTDAEVPA